MVAAGVVAQICRTGCRYSGARRYACRLGPVRPTEPRAKGAADQVDTLSGGGGAIHHDVTRPTTTEGGAEAEPAITRSETNDGGCLKWG